MGLPPGVNLGEGIQLQSPAATPPVLPSPQGNAAPVNDMAAKIMQALARTASRRTMQNTAVPMNVPQPGDDSGRNIGMNTGNPHAWSGQRFGAAISSAIKTAVSNEKQNQLLKAEGNWNNLQSYMNELYAAQDSGDQNAVAAAQKKVDSILADPKMLKNMAKALNQDWLNPEKTTVYGEALKNVMKQTDQKAQAQTGLKGMIMKLLGQKQQLQVQLNEQQRQQMAREIQDKAPSTTGTPDLKDAARIAEEQMKDDAAAKREQMREDAKAAEDERKFKQQEEMKEATEKYQRQRDQMNNTFKEHMETLRDTAAAARQDARDLAMLKATGMRISAQEEKMFAPKPQEIEKQVNDSVTTLRQQLAQSRQQLKSFEQQASSKWFGQSRMKDEISDAKDEVDRLQKAIEHVEKNRDAIVKGKADLGEVISKAYDIMGGADQQAPPPPVAGAVVTQKP